MIPKVAGIVYYPPSLTCPVLYNIETNSEMLIYIVDPEKVRSWSRPAMSL